MDEKLRLEEIFEVMKKEFIIDPDYEIIYGTDDAGSFIDINTIVREYAAELRTIVPNRYMGCRVTVSFYTHK
jgi:putative transposon-encoded protein